jgi:hypothetical protein
MSIQKLPKRVPAKPKSNRRIWVLLVAIGLLLALVFGLRERARVDGNAAATAIQQAIDAAAP